MEKFDARSVSHQDPALIDELERIDRNQETAFAAYGVIEWFTGDVSNIPQTHFLCDGRAVSRNDNKRLFAIMATRYGEGDGETTFNLPDAMGKILKGIGVGEFAGQTEHLDVGTGATYDIDVLRLVPIVRKG